MKCQSKHFAKECGYHGFWPSIPTPKAQTDQSPKKAQVSLHKHRSKPEIQFVAYLITAKAFMDYCSGTPSSSRLPSLRRWSTNDFMADPLQIKNISS